MHKLPNKEKCINCDTPCLVAVTPTPKADYIFSRRANILGVRWVYQQECPSCALNSYVERVFRVVPIKNTNVVGWLPPEVITELDFLLSDGAFTDKHLIHSSASEFTRTVSKGSDTSCGYLKKIGCM